MTLAGKIILETESTWIYCVRNSKIAFLFVLRHEASDSERRAAVTHQLHILQCCCCCSCCLCSNALTDVYQVAEGNMTHSLNAAVYRSELLNIGSGDRPPVTKELKQRSLFLTMTESLQKDPTWNYSPWKCPEYEVLLSNYASWFLGNKYCFLSDLWNITIPLLWKVLRCNLYALYFYIVWQRSTVQLSCSDVALLSTTIWITCCTVDYMLDILMVFWSLRDLLPPWISDSDHGDVKLVIYLREWIRMQAEFRSRSCESPWNPKHFWQILSVSFSQ